MCVFEENVGPALRLKTKDGVYVAFTPISMTNLDDKEDEDCAKASILCNIALARTCMKICSRCRCSIPGAKNSTSTKSGCPESKMKSKA